jgi:hypothetical protein
MSFFGITSQGDYNYLLSVQTAALRAVACGKASELNLVAIDDAAFERAFSSFVVGDSDLAAKLQVRTHWVCAAVAAKTTAAETSQPHASAGSTAIGSTCSSIICNIH